MATPGQQADLAGMATGMAKKPKPVTCGWKREAGGKSETCTLSPAHDGDHVFPTDTTDAASALVKSAVEAEASKPVGEAKLDAVSLNKPKPQMFEDSEGTVRTGTPLPTAKAKPAPVAKPSVPVAPTSKTAPPPPILTRKGRIRGPRRIVVYGPPGVGKTTLVADIENAVMFDIDDGSRDIASLDRWIFNEADPIRGHVPGSLEQLRAAWRRLAQGGHNITTAIVDTADRLELMVMRHCFRRDSEGREKPIRNIEGYGYGKGPSVILDEMRAVMTDLDRLIGAGISVVITAHAISRKFSNPAGEDFDRYVLKCTDTCGKYLSEWADEVAFYHFEEGGTKKTNPMQKSKGWSTGARILEFDRCAAWDAKARLPLPSRVHVGTAEPWEPFREAIRQAHDATCDEVREMIEEQLERIGDDETTTNARAAVTKVGDNRQKLDAYLSNLRRRPKAEVADESAVSVEE